MAQSEQTEPETELPLRTWLISFKTKRYSGERFLAICADPYTHSMVTDLFFFFFFFLINFIGILLSYKSNKREVTRTKKKKKKKLPKGSNERDVSTHARKLPTTYPLLVMSNCE